MWVLSVLLFILFLLSAVALAMQSSKLEKRNRIILAVCAFFALFQAYASSWLVYGWIPSYEELNNWLNSYRTILWGITTVSILGILGVLQTKAAPRPLKQLMLKLYFPPALIFFLFHMFNPM